MPPTLLGRRIADRFVIERTIAGSPAAGLHEGRDEAGQALLISTVSTREDPAELAQKLSIQGGEEEAALLWAGQHRDEDFRLFVAVERRPPGKALVDRLNIASAPAECLRMLLPLVRLGLRLEQGGIVLNLHPRLIFVEGEAVRCAWRLFVLLSVQSSEWKAPLLEPTLSPPEWLKNAGIPPHPRQTVFTLCALGAWMANGRPPYGQSLVEEAKAQLGSSPLRPTLPSELQPILGPGLDPDPGRRPGLATLLRAAEAFLFPVDTSSEPAVVTALKQWKIGRISESALLRVAVAQPWYVAARVGPEGPMPVLEGNRLRLAATPEGLDLYLELPGPALFAGLPEGLAGVELAAGSPAALLLDPAKLSVWRRWGRALLVEDLIAGRSKAPLATLRNFDGWWIVMRELPDGRTQLSMAPDPKGRRLAALFTAEDCRDAYVKIAGAALGEKPLLMMLTGQQIFERLVALPLDGIVFNCMGPVSPRAVHPAFAAEVLKAG